MSAQQEQQSERDWITFFALESDVKTINDYIKFKMEEYEEIVFKNDDLWEQFKEDFATFIEDTFKSVNQTSIRRLRTHLRKYGVWVRKDRRGGTAAQALYQTLLEEDLAPWTEKEIRECLDAGEIFDSRRIDRIFNNGAKTAAFTRPTTVDASEHADSIEAERPGAEQETEQPPEEQKQ